MQLSAEWSRPFGFDLEPRLHSLNAGLARLRVFKAQRDFAMLAAVAATYWLVSATVSSAILFPLVHGIYKVEALRITLATLSAAGFLVLLNEPVRAFVAGHHPVVQAAVTALTIVLGTTAVCYWIDHSVFKALIAPASHSSSDSIAFAASNIVLLAANIILPVLGGGFVLRLTQQTLHPNKTARISVR
jgi:hypothetical protein